MIVAGVILLALAVGAYFILRSQRKRLGALESTDTVACDALVEDQLCEVVGRAAAYEGRPLKGPASGRECVWFRHQVTQHWEEWDRDSKGESQRRNRSKVIEDKTSEGEVFVLRDAAGQVFVNPQGANVDKPVKSFRERRDVNQFGGGGGALATIVAAMDRRMDEEIEVEEWILPVDEEIYVRGRPYRAQIGLTMVKPEGDEFLISTRSEEELAGAAKRWALAATIFGAVAAVAGVALIIAGALA
jgi:hypothetical protein